MSATRWFYVHDDKRMGPVDMEQIVRLVLSAVLPPSTLRRHRLRQAERSTPRRSIPWWL